MENENKGTPRGGPMPKKSNMSRPYLNDPNIEDTLVDTTNFVHRFETMPKLSQKALPKLNMKEDTLTGNISCSPQVDSMPKSDQQTNDDDSLSECSFMEEIQAEQKSYDRSKLISFGSPSPQHGVKRSFNNICPSPLVKSTTFIIDSPTNPDLKMKQEEDTFFGNISVAQEVSPARDESILFGTKKTDALAEKPINFNVEQADNSLVGFVDTSKAYQNVPQHNDPRNESMIEKALTSNPNVTLSLPEIVQSPALAREIETEKIDDLVEKSTSFNVEQANDSLVGFMDISQQESMVEQTLPTAPPATLPELVQNSSLAHEIETEKVDDFVEKPTSFNEDTLFGNVSFAPKLESPIVNSSIQENTLVGNVSFTSKIDGIVQSPEMVRSVIKAENPVMVEKSFFMDVSQHADPQKASMIEQEQQLPASDLNAMLPEIVQSLTLDREIVESELPTELEKVDDQEARNDSEMKDGAITMNNSRRFGQTEQNSPSIVYHRDVCSTMNFSRHDSPMTEQPTPVKTEESKLDREIVESEIPAELEEIDDQESHHDSPMAEHQADPIEQQALSPANADQESMDVSQHDDPREEAMIEQEQHLPASDLNATLSEIVQISSVVREIIENELPVGPEKIDDLMEKLSGLDFLVVEYAVSLFNRQSPKVKMSEISENISDCVRTLINLVKDFDMENSGGITQKDRDDFEQALTVERAKAKNAAQERKMLEARIYELEEEEKHVDLLNAELEEQLKGY